MLITWSYPCVVWKCSFVCSCPLKRVKSIGAHISAVLSFGCLNFLTWASNYCVSAWWSILLDSFLTGLGCSCTNLWETQCFSWDKHGARTETYCNVKWVFFFVCLFFLYCMVVRFLIFLFCFKACKMIFMLSCSAYFLVPNWLLLE